MSIDRTPTILRNIVDRKWEEIAERKHAISLADQQARARDQSPCRGFEAALRAKVAGGDAAVIAEIKKASPSKGVLRDDFNPAEIAQQYEAGGAACLSVLTDRDFFQGHEDYLIAARAACSLPVLRKDFMVAPYQIYESRGIGADCILLIAACLSRDQMQELCGIAHELGMDALVEVHDEAEMHEALHVPSRLLGINNRNLHTFEVSLDTTYHLQALVPANHLLVTESGIMTPDDVAAMRNRHIHSFLIGESFMRAADPGEQLRALFQ